MGLLEGLLEWMSIGACLLGLLEELLAVPFDDRVDILRADIDTSGSSTGKPVFWFVVEFGVLGKGEPFNDPVREPAGELIGLIPSRAAC